VGGIASSAVVLQNSRAKQRAAGSGAIAVDMESGAVARVARTRGVPMLAVRVVIDTLNDTVPDTGNVVDPATGDVRVAQAAAVLVQPRHWYQSALLARRAWTADRHFRRFLSRLLTEGGIVVLAGVPRSPG
jgi:hypothetical protein